MKNFLISSVVHFIGLLFPIFCYSQDNIFIKSGDEVKAKVLEVTTTQIKYKKWANPGGPTYTLEKSEVFMIKYQNGTKDVFNATKNENTLKEEKKEPASFLENLPYSLKLNSTNEKELISKGFEKTKESAKH